MISVYHGDGKGKTTAAVGLAVRAAGNDISVLFVQFLKDGSSGEVRILQQLPGVETRHASRNYGFSFWMTEAQRADTRDMYLAMLTEAAAFAAGQQEASEAAAQSAGELDENGSPVVRRLLVLDEVLHAVRTGLLPEEKLLALMKGLDPHTELVLTGQNPSEAVLSRADYISEVRKLRHPYDRGVLSRKGVEL